MPTSGARGDHASVESDRSRSPAGRHTPAEPALRRQAVHESLRPMTYGTLQGCAPLVTYKSAVQMAHASFD